MKLYFKGDARGKLAYSIDGGNNFTSTTLQELHEGISLPDEIDYTLVKIKVNSAIISTLDIIKQVGILEETNTEPAPELPVINTRKTVSVDMRCVHSQYDDLFMYYREGSYRIPFTGDNNSNFCVKCDNGDIIGLKYYVQGYFEDNTLSFTRNLSSIYDYEAESIYNSLKGKHPLYKVEVKNGVSILVDFGVDFEVVSYTYEDTYSGESSSESTSTSSTSSGGESSGGESNEPSSESTSTSSESSGGESNEPSSESTNQDYNISYSSEFSSNYSSQECYSISPFMPHYDPSEDGLTFVYKTYDDVVDGLQNYFSSDELQHLYINKGKDEFYKIHASKSQFSIDNAIYDINGNIISYVADNEQYYIDELTHGYPQICISYSGTGFTFTNVYVFASDE